MNPAVNERLALVADPDVQFLQKIAQESRVGGSEPKTVATREEVEIEMAERPERYGAVFLNTKICSASAVSLVKFVREHCPTTPIYLIYDGMRRDLSDSDLNQLTVRDTFRKPLTYAEISNAVNFGLKPFDPASVISLRSEDVELMDVEFEGRDIDFSPVRAKSFLAGHESYFDIYIRISKDKYVKILSAGDSIAQDRLEAYLAKGLLQFYIRQKVRAHYLHYCDTLANSLLENIKTPSEVKVSQIANWGEETSKFLRAGGLNEGAVNYARRYVKTVQAALGHLGLERIGVIKNYLETTRNLDHSIGVMMVSSLLAIPLKLESERSASIVGLAALLHDIGLSGMDPKFQSEDESTLSLEELKIFRTHPSVGQQMLAETAVIEPVVLQAVGQHHERRNGNGFPHRLSSGNINLVAEVIGLSEEIFHQMEKAVGNPSYHLLKELEKKCATEFSASTLASIKIFFQ